MRRSSSSTDGIPGLVALGLVIFIVGAIFCLTVSLRLLTEIWDLHVRNFGTPRGKLLLFTSASFALSIALSFGLAQIYPVAGNVITWIGFLLWVVVIASAELAERSGQIGTHGVLAAWNAPKKRP